MISVLAAGLGCKCPRCGQGALYRGFLKLNEHCAVCGLDLAAADVGDGASVFVIFITGFIAVPLILWLELAAQPSWWVHAIVGGGLILGLSWLLLPRVKALLLAQIYATKAAEGRVDGD